MKVRINQSGKVGTAKWDAVVGKFEVAFVSPWVGWYTADEFEVI